MKGQTKMPSRVFRPKTAEAILSLPHDDRAIRAALAEALAQPDFPGEAATDQDLTRLVTQVARSFLVRRDVGAACRVIGAAPPRLRQRMPLQMLKAQILSLMGDIAGLETTLAGLLERPRVAEVRNGILSAATSRFGMGWWLGGACALKPALWGPLPDSPGAWVREGSGEYLAPIVPGLFSEEMLAPVLRVSGLTLAEAQTRLMAQEAASRRAACLYEADMKARLAPEGTPGAAQIIAYHDRFVREEITGDLSPLIAAREAGRNAILLMAHAGSAIRFSKLAALPGPKAIFAHSYVPRPDMLWVPTLRDAATVNLGFMRLARSIRKEPHLVILLPDGMTGSAATEVEVEGTRFRVSLGGAALARVAPSTLFFARSLQRDGRLEVEITEGPQMGPGMDSAESDATFAAFYGEGLARILHSPIEDIGQFGFMRSAVSSGLSDPEEIE